MFAWIIQPASLKCILRLWLSRISLLGSLLNVCPWCSTPTPNQLASNCSCFFTAVSPTPNPSDPAVPPFKRRYSSESGTLTKKWAWFSLVSIFDCWLSSDFHLKNPTSSCPALLITPFWYSCGVTRIWFKKGELPPFLTEVFSERCLGLIFQICPCLSQIPSNKNTKSG